LLRYIILSPYHRDSDHPDTVGPDLGRRTMRIISVAFVSIILASIVPSLATETVKEPLPVKALTVCSSHPNCVSSLGTDKKHRMPPISFSGPVEAAQERLMRVILQMPRAEIVKDEPGYLAVFFSSKIFGFVDEAEFAFDEKSGEINFRSGARTGYYDRSLLYRTEVAIMDKRTEYVEKLSAQMVEWDAQIDQLKIKATSATSEARHEYSNEIAALQIKRDEAALKLQGISTAGDDEWEDLKTGTEQIWGDFTTMLGNAVKKIK
jgi:uncharacterized protein (DUF1499 family)